MLVEFRVQNHRSIRDEQAITMAVGRVLDRDDPRPRTVPGYSRSLLPAAALYGANASGKSNFLGAISFMREAVIYSHRAWGPDDGIPRDPFAWGKSALDTSLYEMTFVLEGVRYEYGFVANDEVFTEEWLYAWPRSRKQMWFERTDDEYKFGDSLGGENRVIQQVTRGNSLFLSTAAQHNHTQISPVFRWFRFMRLLNVGRRRRWLGSAYLDSPSARFSPTLLKLRAERFPSLDEQEEELLDGLRAMLKIADIGIVDIKVVEENDDRRDRSRKRHRVYLRHESQDENDEAWLPLDQESDGTRAIFSLAPYLLESLARGGLFVIDELESSLHPLLARQLVAQFNDPKQNPRNAQILFTTHDTNLLGTVVGTVPLLRRDQVWLTEKSQEGATCAYPLTDYKPRKAENIERGYLQGRYGAIPFLSNLAPELPLEPRVE